MTLPIKWIPVSLILVLLLGACAPFQRPPLSAAPVVDWRPADVCLLDPIDSTSSTHDLIAAYLRLVDSDLQIRLDLWQNVDPLDYDLHVALDTLPGGGEALPAMGGVDFAWDLLLTAPAKGDPSLTAREGLVIDPDRPRVVRDAGLDTITLSLPQQLLAGQQRVAALAWISLPGERIALDLIGPFRLEDAPAARAPLLLEFWDSLPSNTPAQLLRRWDGAHTGPYGQRHGLRYLLLAAQSDHLPLTLLDLAQPGSLRGLELVGGLDLVRSLQNSGLLELPENGYILPAYADTIVAHNRQSATDLGVHSGRSTFGYADSVSGGRLVHAVLLDPAHVQQVNGIRFVPTRYSPGASLDTAQAETIDKNGLTATAVRMLLETALTPDAADLVILGGSLPTSPWGDLIAGGQAMHYIAAHPWMQPLSSADLMTFPVLEKSGLHEIFACKNDALCVAKPDSVTVITPYGLEAANHIGSQELARQIYLSLQPLPGDAFTDAASEMFATLTRPVADGRLASLNASALTQVGFLIEASRWNRQPTAQARCDADLDWDGFAECVLSDETLFAVLDPEGGRLALLAARKDGETYQLIGPTSQTAAGLSNPSDWLPLSGTLADPAEIAGAFVDPASNWTMYTAEPGPAKVTLRDSVHAVTRTFSLKDGALRVVLENNPGVQRLPILLPTLFAHPGQEPAPLVEAQPGSIRWPISASHYAKLAFTGASIDRQASVLDALPLLRSSENPDRAYPAGHYLPFPFLILNISDSRDFIATISIK